jgi:GT2 family glycosyltransferase
MKRLSLIVLSWNTRELTLATLQNLKDVLGASPGDAQSDSEIILVDNGSRDGSAEAAAQRHPDIEQVLLPENVGFAAGMNAGMAVARGERLLLLNTDVEIDAESLAELERILDADERTALVSPQLLHPDGRTQASVDVFPSLMGEFLPRSWRLARARRRLGRMVSDQELAPVVETIRGACMYVRTDAVARVGGLSEDYFFFLEEADWCWRLARAGWLVRFAPEARVQHLGGASSKRVWSGRTRIEYHRSLYRFLGTHRSRAQARLVRGWRFLRTLGAILLFWPAALLIPRQADRLDDRVQLLLWHLRGRPADGGLACTFEAIEESR